MQTLFGSLELKTIELTTASSFTGKVANIPEAISKVCKDASDYRASSAKFTSIYDDASTMKVQIRDTLTIHMGARKRRAFAYIVIN